MILGLTKNMLIVPEEFTLPKIISTYWKQIINKG